MKNDTTIPLFTPLLDGVRQRYENVRIIEDYGFHVRVAGKKKAVVEIEGKRYAVYGRSCGLPNCQCDAEIKLIK